MGLKERELAQDEQVVVEVRRGPSGLVGPVVALVCLTVLAATSLALSRGGASPPGRVVIHGWALIDDRRTLDNMLEVLSVIFGLLGLIALLWLLATWLRWRARNVAVTTLRVVSTEGVLRRRVDQVLLDRIVDLQVDRSVRDRMARRGTVLLEILDGSVVAIEGLSKPDAFARVVLRQAGLMPGASPEDLGAEAPLEGWTVVTEVDPTPPAGTPAVTTSGAAAALIRLDEIDRLESEGLLDPAEAARRRSELGGR